MRRFFPLAALLILAAVGTMASFELDDATKTAPKKEVPARKDSTESARIGGEGDPTKACFIVGNSRNKILNILHDTPADMSYPTFVRRYLPEFKGVKYGAGGRGCPADKTLVNCQQMDCVTLTENVLAMAFTHMERQSRTEPMSDDELFERFLVHLNNIRYYDGNELGWEDRIHYLTDAMRKLQEAGLLKDAGRLKGQPMTKRIDYMSTHKRKYRGIQNWNEVERIEKNLSETERYYYPLDELDTYASVARDGDICALTTTIDGLDVSHVGFITLGEEDGQLKFTHASSTRHHVVLFEDFKEYLDTRTTITGVMVYRPAKDRFAEAN